MSNITCYDIYNKDIFIFQASPDYQEFGKTWLPDDVKDDDICKFIPSQLNKGMIMPVNGGLDGCKKLCNNNSECDAIEYAPSPGEGKVDCCILVKCDGSVPEPTETGEHYHPGQDYEYNGYKKGTPNPILSPNIILIFSKSSAITRTLSITISIL